jgi:hypothetical protein
VATLGKTAMGVRIVNITKPDVVVGVARVVKDEPPSEGQPAEAEETSPGQETAQDATDGEDGEDSSGA